PLAVSQAFRQPKSPFVWMFLFGIAAAVIASQSRTVQALSSILVVYNLFQFARGKLRWWVVCGLTVLLLVVAITDNPIQKRFIRTIQGDFDRQSEYVDDRVAF